LFSEEHLLSSIPQHVLQELDVQCWMELRLKPAYINQYMRYLMVNSIYHTSIRELIYVGDIPLLSLLQPIHNKVIGASELTKFPTTAMHVS
jgi:hypothetical protein